MKTFVISVCKSNESGKNIHLIKNLIADYEHVELKIEECLNRCSFCEDTPYVMINQGIEFGDDLMELLDNIKSEISSNLKKCR